MVVSRAVGFLRVHLGKRFIHYALVSGVAVLITQVVLAVLHGLVGWRASFANIAAVAIATPVSYFMNRAWVWGKRGRSHLRREVAPFWAFSFAGLILSTFLVWIVAQIQNVPIGQRPTAAQQFAINLANIVGFAILWLVQFFVLDKISFKSHSHEPPATPDVENSERRHSEPSATDPDVVTGSAVTHRRTGS